MNQLAYQLPRFGKILPDILAFGLGLGIAWVFKWKTADLVWSLWLGSLVLGYLTILSTIGAGVYVGFIAVSSGTVPGKARLPVILIGSLVALFYLAFFSFHFCGFHAAHAGFLSAFFPVASMSGLGMNPLLLWKAVFSHLMVPYGAFLIPAIVAERNYVFASLIEAVKRVRQGMVKGQELSKLHKAPKGSHQDPFFRPYINVIRMHILIFFFAFCHSLKIESFLIYAVVYCVYFFPWKAFSRDDSITQVGNKAMPVEA